VDKQDNSQEIRNRIKCSVAAYAYEIRNESIMTDMEFDSLCREIKYNEPTGNAKMDTFFRNEFNPSTGQWIHNHPELKRIAEIYENYYEGKQ